LNFQKKQNKKFFTEGQFLKFCRNVFGYYRITGGGSDIEVVCPYCKKKKGSHYSNRKFSISLVSHKLGLVNCWVCGYSSKNLLHTLKIFFPSHLQTYIENFLDGSNCLNPTKEKEKQPFILRLPEDFVLLATANQKWANIRRAMNYLKERNASSLSDLWYWKMGICTNDKHLLNRIIIPSYNLKGEINYYSARAMNKWQKPKYINPEIDREEIIFNELNIDWTQELTLVEGVFDLIKCNDNASCLLGSDLTTDYKLFQEIVKNNTPVALALDPEAFKKTLEIAKLLFEFDIPVRIVQINSRQGDVGKLTKRDFKNLLIQAKPFDMKFRLKSKIASII